MQQITFYIEPLNEAANKSIFDFIISQTGESPIECVLTDSSHIAHSGVYKCPDRKFIIFLRDSLKIGKDFNIFEQKGNYIRKSYVYHVVAKKRNNKKKGNKK